MLQRLLLLPLLAPLLAVLLVAALNPRPSTSLRLLIWSSPALPIGAWLALAAGGGAALSASLTALALQPQRQERGLGAADVGPEPWERMAEPPRRASPDRESTVAPAAWTTGGAGPERGPQDPSPTVAVPFRILRRGHSGQGERTHTGRTGATTTSGPVAANSTAKAAASERAGQDGEGWDIPLSDDW